MENENINREAVDGYIERWAAVTHDVPEDPPRIPLKVLLGEAIDLAELIDQNFATRRVEGGERLGLESVADLTKVTPVTATELRELQLAASFVHSRYVFLAEESNQMPIAVAEEILSELRAGLSFVLDDGEHEQGEEQLERLRNEFSKLTSHDGMALALEAHAELASQYEQDLRALGGFDIGYINQALRAAQSLRMRSAERLTGQVAQRQRELLALRNRLLGALSDRMKAARRAFRFVFRDDPLILRQISSDYWRATKRKSRDRSTASDAEISGGSTAGMALGAQVPSASAEGGA